MDRIIETTLTYWWAQRRTIFKQNGITASQFKILQALVDAKRQHASSQQFLAAATDINKMVVSQTIDALYKKRLLWRIQDPLDTRKNTVRLGALGKHTYKQTNKALKAFDKDFLSKLSPAERKQLKKLLVKITRTF